MNTQNLLMFMHLESCCIKFVTNSIAFNDIQNYKILNEIVNGPKLPNTISSAYRDLIKRCWSSDPNKRPTFSQIVEELKKPEFTNDIDDMEKFFECIKLIDEYPSKYDNNKNVFKIYNPQLESKLNHVKKID